MKNKVLLFKALADENRLSILKTLYEKPSYVEVLSERLSLSPSTISFHLKKLESVNAVTSFKDQYYKIFKVNTKVFKKSLLDLVFDSSSVNKIEEKREQNYEEKIIKNFIRYGKIVSIPVQRKKRLVLLKHLAKHFSHEKEYKESEVNEVLSQYHEDVCTLRREFIAEELFKRKSGIYKRL